MNIVLFLARHTPFWSIPLIVIALQYGKKFKEKKKKVLFGVCITFAVFSALCTIIYVLAGGPEATPKLIQEFMYNYLS